MAIWKTVFRLLLGAAFLAMAACATAPPVQEMSDARQAIAAAREAGAATLDDVGFRQAEAQLADAEARLQQGLYWDARKQAVHAKESAIAALLRSRSLREAGATAVPVASPPVASPP